jgi:hypothetical protein
MAARARAETASLSRVALTMRGPKGFGVTRPNAHPWQGGSRLHHGAGVIPHAGGNGAKLDLRADVTSEPASWPSASSLPQRRPHTSGPAWEATPAISWARRSRSPSARCWRSAGPPCAEVHPALADRRSTAACRRATSDASRCPRTTHSLSDSALGRTSPPRRRIYEKSPNRWPARALAEPGWPEAQEGTPLATPQRIERRVRRQNGAHRMGQRHKRTFAGSES